LIAWHRPPDARIPHLDRLSRSLKDVLHILEKIDAAAAIHDLMERGICFRVLTGQGANIDTTTASGRLVFGIFAPLAEFERELIHERTIAGLSSARASGRNCRCSVHRQGSRGERRYT
jgi:DNA invertase Pin-like site-specific DNA recombinase